MSTQPRSCWAFGCRDAEASLPLHLRWRWGGSRPLRLAPYAPGGGVECSSRRTGAAACIIYHPRDQQQEGAAAAKCTGGRRNPPATQLANDRTGIAAADTSSEVCGPHHRRHRAGSAASPGWMRADTPAAYAAAHGRLCGWRGFSSLRAGRHGRHDCCRGALPAVCSAHGSQRLPRPRRPQQAQQEHIRICSYCGLRSSGSGAAYYAAACRQGPAASGIPNMYMSYMYSCTGTRDPWARPCTAVIQQLYSIVQS